MCFFFVSFCFCRGVWGGLWFIFIFYLTFGLDAYGAWHVSSIDYFMLYFFVVNTRNLNCDYGGLSVGGGVKLCRYTTTRLADFQD